MTLPTRGRRKSLKAQHGCTTTAATTVRTQLQSNRYPRTTPSLPRNTADICVPVSIRSLRTCPSGAQFMMARMSGRSRRFTATISGELPSLMRPTVLSGDRASASWADDSPDANCSKPTASPASTSCATDVALAKDALEDSARRPRVGEGEG